MTPDRWHKLIEVAIGFALYTVAGLTLMYAWWWKGVCEHDMRLRWVVLYPICIALCFIALALILTPMGESGLWKP